MTPTKQAVEAARERLARVADAREAPNIAYGYRRGDFDGSDGIQALAIALQEMSDVLKAKQLDGPNCGFTRFILPEPVCPIKSAADAVVAERFPIASPQNEWALQQVAYHAVKRGMELANREHGQ
jgi:hypothetical protein